MEKIGTLVGKRIVLGVSGGISAYKSAEIIRLLRKQGAEVRVVLTHGAEAFITPLTLQTLSGHPVHRAILDLASEAEISHISLAKWADLTVIAPATANILAKLNAGISDDFLTTLCLATSAPIAIAPAMNQQMFLAKATQNNLISLEHRGVHIWGPGEGEQACGDLGPGRLLEPTAIIEHIQTLFSDEKPLKGLKITVTAGPTQEAIDPVRYLSNHSSGKMGVALAQAAKQMGANVTLICGPMLILPPENMTVINVTSALEMEQATLQVIDSCDIFIGCAAVADYRVEEISKQKIKKEANLEKLTLTLTKNTDIITTVSHHQYRPFCVGFAAETENLADNAKKKLVKKNLDLIIANDVSKQGIGFNSNENAVTVFARKEKIEIARATKNSIAERLINIIYTEYKNSSPSKFKASIEESK